MPGPRRCAVGRSNTDKGRSMPRTCALAGVIRVRIGGSKRSKRTEFRNLLRTISDEPVGGALLIGLV